MKIATFEKEKELSEKKYDIIVGLDEVGRGPLAGPVVTAACVIKNKADFESVPDEGAWKLVRDSKLLSEKQREEAFIFVQKRFFIGIGKCSPKAIDEINILQATFLAMKKAINGLEKEIDIDGRYGEAEKMMIMIDGNQLLPNFTREQMCVAKGDQISKSIAAASIIAKVARDKMILVYDKKYPQYGFANHKGYGTKMHMEALQKYGATPIHRRSFAPVKRVL
ncbi:MAG TPA: ribonuclease HII [Candidatus Pacebacteria bacterium]|nr:ribonuclease HII [Candidatus Paceibacterota bacterium]